MNPFAAQVEQKQAELQAILALGASVTDEQVTAAEGLAADLEALRAKSATLSTLGERAKAIGEWAGAPAMPVPHSTQQQAPGLAGVTNLPAQGWQVPASARRYRITAFKDDPGGLSAQQKAYGFGQWVFAALGKRASAQRWCREHGIAIQMVDGDGNLVPMAAHVEDTNTAGGALVPVEFDNDIIDLREQYGVFRRYARNKPMGSDTRNIPRRTGGLTVYNPGEAASITESQKSWDNVNLVAKKFAVLAKYSSELGEDAMIDIGNDLAGEIAYAFSNKEDECGFNGDGTQGTYFGITGIRSKILGLSATRANIAGLIVGTGNLYSELALVDFEAVVGRLPQYADTPNTAWFCHRSFYWNVMIRLMLASGGVTEAEVSRQGRNVPFLGYPVVVSQVMPNVEANDQVCALFGDMAQGVFFGDRRQNTIAMSEHSDFASDLIAIRGTQRIDINFHSPGNASATASARVPGPVVALATAAS